MFPIRLKLSCRGRATIACDKIAPQYELAQSNEMLEVGCAMVEVMRRRDPNCDQ